MRLLTTILTLTLSVGLLLPASAAPMALDSTNLPAIMDILDGLTDGAAPAKGDSDHSTPLIFIAAVTNEYLKGSIDPCAGEDSKGRAILEVDCFFDSFVARISTHEQVKKVTVRGWDPKKKWPITGKSTDPSPSAGLARDLMVAMLNGLVLEAKETKAPKSVIDDLTRAVSLAKSDPLFR